MSAVVSCIFLIVKDIITKTIFVYIPNTMNNVVFLNKYFVQIFIAIVKTFFYVVKSVGVIPTVIIAPIEFLSFLDALPL